MNSFHVLACCSTSHGSKAMKNVGVRVAHEQQLGAYMGFLMLVPWAWELRGHLDLPPLCRWHPLRESRIVPPPPRLTDNVKPPPPPPLSV